MNLLMQMKVRTRLLALSLLALIGMIILTTIQLHTLKQSMLEDRMAQVKSQVETAQGVIEHFRALSSEGKLSTEEAQKAAVATLRKVRYNKTDYFFIFDTKQVYLLQPTKPEVEGQYQGDMQDSNGKFLLKDMTTAAQSGGGFVDYYFAKPGSKTPEPKLSYATLIGDWNWVLGTGVYIDDINSEFYSNLQLAIIELLVMAILISALAWLIMQSVVRQLGGEPQNAINVMRRIADGDLQADVGNAAPGSLLATLGEMTQGLRQIIRQIRSDAEVLSTQAAQIAGSSKEISIAANRQADATTSMASAMEELTVSINHISDSSEITRQTSQEATTLAQESVHQVASASAVMEEIAGTVSGATEQIRQLDAKAREISGIAAVIKDIAGQTNLLALNAAIEAARAGEQGRGFAVVADEVRKLAERTSSATVDIEQMLGAVQAETLSVVGLMDKAIPQVNQGVALSRNVADSLNRIQVGAQNTLSHLHEVADATREQGMASNSIATRVEDISQMVEETSVSITQSADNAAHIDSIARQLNQLLQRFKV